MGEREAALEAALVEYVEKYGLTDKARAAFLVMGTQPADDRPGGSNAEGAGDSKR